MFYNSVSPLKVDITIAFSDPVIGSAYRYRGIGIGILFIKILHDDWLIMTYDQAPSYSNWVMATTTRSCA